MTFKNRISLSILSLALLFALAPMSWAQDAPEPAPGVAEEAPPEETPPPIETAIESAVDRGQTAATTRSEVVSAAGASESPIIPASDEALISELTDPEITADELALRTLPLTTSELSQLAEAWQRIAKGMTKAVVEEQLAVSGQEAAGSTVPRDRLTELLEVRNAAFDNLSTVATALEAKGGDEAEVAGYRAYRAAIRVDETQRADWRTLVAQVSNWATDRDGGLKVLLRIVIIAAALIGLLIVAKTTRSLANRGLNRVQNLSKLLRAFLVMVVYWLTIAFGLMIVLSALGINVTPLFALVGGASFIIAFAMQDTLGNLAAGLMIMINRPFDEGDYVTVAGTGGTVQSVSIVSTKVVTPDNQVIIIPNSKVWGDVITNVTASKTRRVDFTFGIGYGDSIEKAQEVLEKVVSDHPLILDDPAPVIRVNALGSSSVDFICRPWVKVEDYWTVYWDLTRQVKEAFDTAGISIPFPQTDMHVHMAKPDTLPAFIATPANTQKEEAYYKREDRVTSFKEGDGGHDEET